ncbi:TetR/AcrR family transcriptional regulator, partial [Streptomyces rochei]|nr:TetR/AcrR family transcriptional regulator [Streptomyces rochei]
LAADLGLARATTACRAIARFVVDARALAREADDPRAAVEEIFVMIEAAWAATGARTD